MHLITDNFIDWQRFQELLIKNKFGKVLHYKLLPNRVAIGYATKYITKSIYNLEYPSDFSGRLWAASLKLLPMIVYHDPDGSWQLLWIDRPGAPLFTMLDAFIYDCADSSPPDYPWEYRPKSLCGG
jgi:hypothetical protein